jgi:hypothetical protein
MSTRVGVASTRRSSRGKEPDFKLQTLYLNVRRLAELAGNEAVQRAVGGFSSIQPHDKPVANAVSACWGAC